MTDNEIIKALECCSDTDCDNCPFEEQCRRNGSLSDIALDLINRLKKENDDLFYKLEGVMLSVDKWLEGDELKLDEVNRAVTMREKTLQIIEQQKAEIDKLNIAFDICKQEYNDMFEIAKNQKAEIERLNGSIMAGAETVRAVEQELETAKFTAIKEFAEILKEKHSETDMFCPRRIISMTETALDNLVKEMAGD